ncbi:hypothetical protein [Rhizobium sp. LC145]|uniref:hypothetical protein n=1 Tax=Rhizobium sp. LC145 TaxID=1120688 RepID=UPI000ADD53F2|nr:hypothetical protein [Rhizobium sp. LC145]
MKLTALKTFRHGSSVYRRNELVEMSEAQAKPLLAKKLVEAAKEDSKPTAKSKTAKAAE